jgi:hypothetical protein
LTDEGGKASSSNGFTRQTRRLPTQRRESRVFPCGHHDLIWISPYGPDAVERRPIFGTHSMTKGAANNLSFVETMMALRVSDLLCSRPFIERRKLLAKLLRRVPDNIRFSEDFRGTPIIWTRGTRWSIWPASRKTRSARIFCGGIRSIDCRTADLPNWGYALSAGKSVVMVCGTQREKFPFDVQHRSIIRYQTGSPRDFQALKSAITERLTKFDRKGFGLTELVKGNPLAETSGVTAFELIILAIIVGNSFGADDTVPEYYTKKEAEKNGLTDFATALALRKLLRKEYLSSDTIYDQEAESAYKAHKLTRQGWDWVIEHENEFAIQRPGN